MKNLILIIVVAFITLSVNAQTSVDLATILKSKVYILTGFKENVLPYINLNENSKEEVHPKSHILQRDMNIEDIIETYGARAFDTKDMASLLTNALVSGNLNGVKLIKNSANIFFVLINKGNYAEGYFVNLFWNSTYNAWMLNAHEIHKTIAKSGAQVFTSY